MKSLICTRKPVKFNLSRRQELRTMDVYPMDDLIVCVLWMDLLTAEGAPPRVVN